MVQSFNLDVLYSTLAVFDPDLEYPFNDWQAQAHNQGFSWRSGSVSFLILDDTATVQVEIELNNQFKLLSNTIRAFRIPFSVSKTGLVEIASPVSEPKAHLTKIPYGEYALYFEVGYIQSEQNQNKNTMNEPKEGEEQIDSPSLWCRLTFIPCEDAQAEILVRDPDLSPSYPLLMNAQPA